MRERGSASLSISAAELALLQTILHYRSAVELVLYLLQKSPPLSLSSHKLLKYHWFRCTTKEWRLLEKKKERKKRKKNASPAALLNWISSDTALVPYPALLQGDDF